MIKNRAGLSAALFLASLYSCRPIGTVQTDQMAYLDEPDISQQTKKVMIRVENKGNQQIDDLVVSFAASDSAQSGHNSTYQEESYGSLAPTETSEYHHITSSLRYAPMKFSIGGELLREGVTDFVGEFSIPNGNYTYELAYDPVKWDTVNERMDSRLFYDRTPIDRAIDRALGEEIAEAIAHQYYKNHIDGTESRGLIFSRLSMDCAHQQTHRSSSQDSEQTVVYAKLICTQPAYYTQPDEPRVELEALSPLPIRIELQEEGDLFLVTNYQFPRKGANYERDMRSLFPPQIIEEIDNTKIRETTRNELNLDGM